MKKFSSAKTTPRPRCGRILTFYSYKGGTGRSMTLANTAWILAANGQRVLMIDWDLEGPGLHRYFRPFLHDEELQNTEGLVDFFFDFAEASRLEERRKLSKAENSGQSWFHPFTDLVRCAIAVNHDFPRRGALHLVCAGRQDAAYAVKVNGFHWQEFYEKLGGGVFLEVVKKELRKEYDYILIDSRTGLSDTSGICTVQMPDDLVVCFTLNRQSIFGAGAAARSADLQRRKPNGEPGLPIWPVPMRVELAERDRLETARTLMREQFTPLLWHLKRADRDEYWGKIEVLYFAYYAYEEILATVADRPNQSATLLRAMENLTRELTRNKITSLPRVSESDRAALISRYAGDASAEAARRTTALVRVFVSYSLNDIEPAEVRGVVQAIQKRNPEAVIFWDQQMPPWPQRQSSLAQELKEAQVLVLLIGNKWVNSQQTIPERRALRSAGKVLVPVFLEDAIIDEMPPEIQMLAGAPVRKDHFDEDVGRLADVVAEHIGSPKFQAVASRDPEDPHKGQWGGSSKRNGRELTAKVKAVSKNWFQITLKAITTRSPPLEGIVKFHLHPTFDPSVETVQVKHGIATLQKHAYGAFTIGALLDDGRTRLELDLATIRSAPKAFRER